MMAVSDAIEYAQFHSRSHEVSDCERPGSPGT